MTAVLNEHSRNSQGGPIPEEKGGQTQKPTWRQGVNHSSHNGNKKATRRNRQSLVLSLSLLLQVSPDTWLTAHRSTLQS